MCRAHPETTVPRAEEKLCIFSPGSLPFGAYSKLTLGAIFRRGWVTPRPAPQLLASRVPEMPGSHNAASRDIVPSQDVLHEKSYSEPGSSLFLARPRSPLAGRL